MTIYVGNLPWSGTEQEDVFRTFTDFGEVTSVQLIYDRDSGDFRGFGFVDMPDAREAMAAIDGLNGIKFNNRPMRVNEAKARPVPSQQHGRNRPAHRPARDEERVSRDLGKSL